MAANLTELSPQLQQKLAMLQQKLGTEDLESALDKSLNIADYITDAVSTIHAPNSSSKPTVALPSGAASPDERSLQGDLHRPVAIRPHSL